MPKNLFQDMVRIKRAKKEVKKLEAKPVSEPRIEKTIKIVERKKPRYKLWFVAFISLIFLFFALSFLFTRAQVAVIPKIKDVVLNENLSASKGSTDSLSFDLVVISGEEQTVLPTNKQEDVTTISEGVAVIYNVFSSSPQTLNIETRLEGSNGKIYKTKSKVVVPGKTSKPGSVEVKIMGSKAGPEYNSIPLDFKIAGFKGTAKYDKFYGRSKGDVSGGFRGKVGVVSKEEKDTATKALRTVLETKLLKKATDQIPSGFILFKNAVFLDLVNQDGPLAVSSDNTLTIKIKGTLYGILFDEKKLTQKIALNKIDKYDGSEVFIPDIRNLIFSFAGNVVPTDFNSLKNTDFNLSGNAKIVWKVDMNKLVLDLLGKKKKEFGQILSQYGNISSASLVLSPMWRMSLPEKIKDIKVIVNYPK